MIPALEAQHHADTKPDKMHLLGIIIAFPHFVDTGGSHLTQLLVHQVPHGIVVLVSLVAKGEHCVTREGEGLGT